tara:strand:- start:464 stop:808 length:345 start_codon:yes stop_codon:yes gene_type:complete
MSSEKKNRKYLQKSHFLKLFEKSPQTAHRYLNIFFMNPNNSSDQNVSINVNLSLKNETLRMLIEMANDMGASLEDVISSITEDSVIDLERLQDDLGIVIIPEKCSKQDLINSIQ